MSENSVLIGPAEPAAVEIHPGGGRVLLTCDHASNRVPRALNGLGLDPARHNEHIAWDIGAAAVTRELGLLLRAPAILTAYSRLVIDCNRNPDDPTSIPAESNGVVVPANQGLAAADRAARREIFFDPYHAAIARWLAEGRGRGIVPALLSIHSFTPAMAGKARPWHVGILWDGDGRVPLPLLEALRGEAALMVGDNQPYSAREPAGYTVRHHALEAGLPHVAVEIRQDEISTEAGAKLWAQMLAKALMPILAAESLYRLWKNEDSRPTIA